LFSFFNFGWVLFDLLDFGWPM